MKLIPLYGKHATGSNAFAQVDDEDYDFLMQWKWVVCKNRRSFYVHRNYFDPKIKNTGKVSMHRAVMRVTDGAIAVDHIDHNGLNNQKSNLRLCYNYENAKNKSSKLNKQSKYLGVFFRKDCGKWTAKVGIGPKGKNKSFFLGYFLNEKEAAIAYDKKAKELHGEFANLNFK